MRGRRLTHTMISDRILEHPELLLLKRPADRGGPGADPRIAARVSEILLAIERGGDAELRRVSRELDGWDPPSFELTPAEIAAAERQVEPDLRRHLQLGRDRTEAFARAQRATLTDLEHEVAPASSPATGSCRSRASVPTCPPAACRSSRRRS